jgi:two-component system, NarL family, nitrate/nitrite response regulator NarL
MSGTPPRNDTLRVALQPADPGQRDRVARMVGEAGHVVVAEQAGADILLVDVPAGMTPQALDTALRAVAAGLRARRLGALEPAGFAAAEEEGPPVLLTPREMEILTAIGEGSSNKEIARRLGISTHTVKFHLEAVFAKLDASSRAEAVAKGLRRGLIEL